MAAYASSRLELASNEPHPRGNLDRIAFGVDPVDAGAVLDALIDQLAERVAQRLAGAGPQSSNRGVGGQDDWLDSRHAAEYLEIHRDTLRKLAAERAIPSEQDGPNCKLFFRRSDLDAWRRSGGRPRHLAATLQRVA
jgi:excisionase family DNA binding protein